MPANYTSIRRLVALVLCGILLLLSGCGDNKDNRTALVLTPVDGATATTTQTSSSFVVTDFSPDLMKRDAVDDSYFIDAAFFGNSLMDGVGQFGGLRYGSFYAATSAAVFNVRTTLNTTLSDGTAASLYQAVTEVPRGKIYVLLGINEIAYELADFISQYGGILDSLREDEPNAILYVLSMSPVTKSKSDTHEYFNMTRINKYNEALHQLCVEKGCYYIDLCDCLAGADGYMPDSYANDDGIHPLPDKYPLVAEYIRTHYAGEYQYNFG